MITLPKIETDDMLTTAQFAEQVNSRADIVQKYCQRKVIPGAIKAGNSWLIPESQVEEFKRNRRPRGRPRKPA